ncbi:penicillin-binding protein [Frankia sp. CNm7]|uniref:Penicillin-binding protein n=2 Tax=Frankia nepalensis TaxID=1836974 RepID=A0A937UQK0_9ACTN|nr:penicillin-binding transpeptidase domain-containing protein [Frankia nepalensis]MBL7496779.1 penicillin-binding protein [Frankia nepalensis]MBL7511685.1 penicillin-binding protein [Frankia nepalensis]MBL7523537.1 penicillin-binding protein [Frankia nepalensis]MBL7628335.1 penicillin-binding protein [Frankia nepalensis]
MAVVVLLGAGVGGGFLWKAHRDRAAADRAVRDVAQAYLAAWRALDRTGPALATATTPGLGPGGSAGTPSPSSPSSPSSATVAPASLPWRQAAGHPADAYAARAEAGIAAVTVPGSIDVPTLVATMADMRDRLRLTDAAFTVGEVRRAETTATVPYTATLRLAGQPAPWIYPGELSLTKVGGGWRVGAALASVHPQLAPGLRFDRTGSTAKRGELLDAHGKPLAESPELAGNLVGQVAPATGLERVYDGRLAPRGGSIVLRDSRGTVVRTPQTWPMTDGDQIRTTIDLGVQRAAELALATSTHPIGAMVAVDTRTGGILAAANHPTNGYGRALRGSYPPGSTFKIVTATAALMAGRDANTRLDCPKTVNVGGRTFVNAEDEEFGPINLREAFAHSCNTAFVSLADSLPADTLAQAARLYGFDGAAPLPIASVGGVYPMPRDKVEVASAAIGQGRVATSPLQLASVAAAVAGGTWHAPFVVGGPTRSHELPPKILPDLRSFLRAVVTDGTAAKVAFPGEVFGKTGTAEYAPGNPPPTHAWFVGYRGTVAFAVLIENGGFGAESAAPVAAAFLNALDGNLPPPATAVDASGATPAPVTSAGPG